MTPDVAFPHRVPAIENAYDKKMPLIEAVTGGEWANLSSDEITKRVKTLLDPRSIGKRDPRLYFMSIYPLFALTVTYDQANPLLAEELIHPNGFWRNTLEQITAKKQHDLVDAVFISHAAGVVYEIVRLATGRHSLIQTDVSWAEAYLKQNDTLTKGVGELMDLLMRTGNGTSATNYLEQISRVDQIIEACKLQPQAVRETKRVFAGHILNNFTMTSCDHKDRSAYFIYCERAEAHVRGITVGRELSEWADALVWIQTVFSGKEKDTVVKAISNKVIRDAARELTDTQRRHPELYDEIFKIGVIYFLKKAQLTPEVRKSIYDRVPDLLVLPTETEHYSPHALKRLSVITSEIETVSQI